MLFLILTLVWAGIIIGVSLIATPIKFQAPSLTLQTGLEIGRYTFRFLGRVELGLLIAVLIAASLSRPRPATWVMLAIIVAAIALQRLWLLPFLDTRVSEVLAGGPPSFSLHHRIFAGMEVAKAALLMVSAALEYGSRLG
jgi:hypothetical protein